MPPQNLRMPEGLEHWSKLPSCIGLLSVKKNKGSSYGSIYQKQLYLKKLKFHFIASQKICDFQKAECFMKEI